MIVFGLFLKIIDVFEFFILLFQNKSSYLQCSTFESGDEGSPNNFAAGIFYV